MLKNILNLNGAQPLSKNEQKEINGGIPYKNGCLDGGFLSGIDGCLCTSGTYNQSTRKCVNGQATGKLYENATGCCYNQIGGEF